MYAVISFLNLSIETSHSSLNIEFSFCVFSSVFDNIHFRNLGAKSQFLSVRDCSNTNKASQNTNQPISSSIISASFSSPNNFGKKLSIRRSLFSKSSSMKHFVVSQCITKRCTQRANPDTKTLF